MTVKPIIVLLCEIPMNKDRNKVYDQVDTTPDTLFDHQIELPNTAAIIDNIMADNTVDMATLKTYILIYTLPHG